MTQEDAYPFQELFIVSVPPLYEILLFWGLGDLNTLLKPCWFLGRQLLLYYTSVLRRRDVDERKLFRFTPICYFLALSLIACHIRLILHPQ